MRHAIRLLFVLTGLCVAVDAQAQNFSQAMHDIFGSGKQFRDYQWLDYPLDNFGVATAYRDTKERTDPRHFLCATFSCLGIAPVPTSNADPSKNKQWLSLMPSGAATGYADYACGGPLDAELTRKSKSALSVLLPKIFELVGLTADVQHEANATATVKFSSACSRLLTSRIEGFVRDLLVDDYGIRQAALAGQLVLVKGDVVINTFVVTVAANKKVKDALDLKLQGNASAKFGDDSKFGVELSREQNDQYDLKTASPLIVGVLAARQPVRLGIGPAAFTLDPTKWRSVRIPLPAATGDLPRPR